MFKNLSMLRNLRIGLKIGILAGALLALIVAVSVSALLHMRRVGTQVEMMVDEHMPLIDMVAKTQTAQARVTHNAERIMHYLDIRLAQATGRGQFSEAEWQTLVRQAKGHLQADHEIIKRNLADARLLSREAVRTALNEREKAEHERWVEMLAGIETEYNVYKSYLDRVIAAGDAGRFREALAEEAKIEEHEELMTAGLGNVGKVFDAFATEFAEEAESIQNSAWVTVLAIALLSLVLGTAIGLYVSRAITRPLSTATDIAGRISAGDRAVDISETAEDETGKLLATLGEMATAIQKGEEALEERAEAVEAANEAIRVQTDTIMELSTPVIELWDQIVLMPLLGVVDTQRSQQMMDKLLGTISATRARVAILDVTGVPVMDTAVARHLISIVDGAKVLGAATVITGFSPEAAQTLAQLGLGFQGMHTRGSLSEGVAEAFSLLAASRAKQQARVDEQFAAGATATSSGGAAGWNGGGLG